MLNERLKAVLESAAQLPPEAQEKLASQIEAAIANARWDMDLNDPNNDGWLAEWIQEAHEDEVVDFPKPHKPNAPTGDEGDSRGHS